MSKYILPVAANGVKVFYAKSYTAYLSQSCYMSLQFKTP